MFRIKFILLLSTLAIQSIFSQSLKFNNLTVHNGLSNNKVNTIAQDSSGFIWFGTDNGLNRFDGYYFKVFKNDSKDSNSISDNIIWALSVDQNNNLWAGTKGGFINKYDPVNEKFTKWEVISTITNENSVTDIYTSKNGTIWIGTRRDGIYSFEPDLKKLTHWNSNKFNGKSLSYKTIRAINEDSSGNIIVGTYNGLNKFDPHSSNSVTQIYYEKRSGDPIDNQIYNISKSIFNQNVFWIGTPKYLIKFNSKNNRLTKTIISNPNNLQFGSGPSSVIEEIINGDTIIWTDTYSGLVRINKKNAETIRFLHNENNSNSLVDNQINKIFKDKSGVIWIATRNGISYYSAKSTKFNSYLKNDFRQILSYGYSKGNINSIKAKNGNVYFGTSNGISQIKNINNEMSFINNKKLSKLNVWSLAIDKDNSFWIGTFGQGLHYYNSFNNNLIDWNDKYASVKSSAKMFNKALMLDKDQNLWIGFWGLGIMKINNDYKNYSTWISNENNEKSLNVNDVWSICQDHFGRIWFGTQGGGLNLLDEKNGGIFSHFLKDKNVQLNDNNINVIIEANKFLRDSLKTLLWIGTLNGLNKFEITNTSQRDLYEIEINSEFYTTENGLSDNTIHSILEDDNGNLWLGTESGISFFDSEDKTFNNFTYADGINGSQMNSDAAVKLKNGNMLMGGANGLNIFDPNEIKLSNFKPNLVFTDFKLFNNSIKIENKSILNKSLNYIDKIELAYDQNVFSIQFSALDYNASASVKYLYMLENFDKAWIDNGDRRFASYTNLSPGEYYFKVKCTNADGVWNEKISSLKIIINPPWWKTTWANSILVLLIIFGVYSLRRFEINRLNLRNELKAKEFEVKQKSELEKIKSRFFANLSHEFRTPLMLIKGPLQNLRQYFGTNKNENIDLIERNSDQLEKLIDQLLELSKLENASILLSARQHNIVIILKGLISSYESILKDKNIELIFENNLNDEIIWLDKDKFEKIINNLLSNAIKFTYSGGKINISLNEKINNSTLELTISDTGISIPEDKLDKIFDRFFQVEDPGQRSHGGSGIGLSLVKEFIDLHKWKVSVKSEKGKSTEFLIEIPYGDKHLNENEKINPESEVLENKNINDEINQSSYEQHNSKQTNAKNNNEIILIVDDSSDVRKYLSGLLSDDYQIYQAENGSAGIKIANEISPDIIICDVMMPSMDGMEFCGEIKNNWQTCDIPIILLTAKATFETKIEGLNIGADEFLTKPFETQELFVRIKNLIEQRKRIAQKYSKNIDVLYDSNKLSTSDNEFIQKVIQLIEINLDKLNYGTEKLAKDLFISRTKLHRKMLEISDQAPGEFIRNIKMKKAAKLLLENKLSVTQIAFEIGFSSPSQFSRAFSKQYNCLPSEFYTNHKG